MTLKSVEVHRAGGEGDPWIVVAEDPGTFDLVDLEGVQELLGSKIVDAGKYTQIRMEVEEVKLKIVDEEELQSARIPNGRIKVVRPFEVVTGEKTVLLLDFEGDKSLVVTGNPESTEGHRWTA